MKPILVDDLGWKKFLHLWSLEEIRLINKRMDLGHPVWAWQFLKSQLSTNYLGFSGGTNEEIKSVENTLNAVFPISYKNFLQASNGWKSCKFHLYGLKDINYLRNTRPDLCRLFKDAFPPEDIIEVPDEVYFDYDHQSNTVCTRYQHIQECILIGDTYDKSASVLLNKNVQFENGEWEVWLYHWRDPEPYRFPSFKKLMEHSCFSSLNHLKLSSDEPDAIE